MFWRLFLTYLLLVVLAVGLVGMLILQREQRLVFELADGVVVAVTLVILFSVAPAYLLAERFARPLSANCPTGRGASPRATSGTKSTPPAAASTTTWPAPSTG
jgi:hypothetical protein